MIETRPLQSTLVGQAQLTDGTTVHFVPPAQLQCSSQDKHRKHPHLVSGSVKACAGTR